MTLTMTYECPDPEHGGWPEADPYEMVEMADGSPEVVALASDGRAWVWTDRGWEWT